MNPNNEKIVREYDEAMTTVLRMYPDSLYSFYSTCIEKGFDPKQALRLTIEWFRILLNPR
jgi:hypothetical protein